MKIFQCRVHSTGALVLDPNDYDGSDDNLEYRARTRGERRDAKPRG